jgi:homopolymeric O-antigen transport system ATP-binding protein
MTDAIISIEQLGKRYVIAHQRERAHYKTLRETMTLKVRDVLNGWHVRNGNNGVEKATREEFWALKDVSFEVKRGEVLGIIGRNGAGKSTLLKLLSRITEPSCGRMRIRGRVACLLEVGTGFHPELTGRENVFLNGAILGMSKAEIKRKFDEIVAFSEVEKFLDTPVKRYSSGMYVRLAFAVAAHLEPEILIIDEVLAVGDAQFQKKCLGKMHDVSREGRTVLFVSHNMAAVRQLTSRSLVLSQGRTVFNGTTEDAIARYTEDIGDTSATFFNVEHIPRKGLGTGAVRMLALWFDRDTPRFGADEHLEFAIRMRALENITGFFVCVTLFTSDGMAIGSSFGPESIVLSRNEECNLKVKMPSLNAAPGRYHCSVGIANGDPTSGCMLYDGVMEALHFEIMPTVGEAGTLTTWSPSWGITRFPQLQVSQITSEEVIGK